MQSIHGHENPVSEALVRILRQGVKVRCAIALLDAGIALVLDAGATVRVRAGITSDEPLKDLDPICRITLSVVGDKVVEERGGPGLLPRSSGSIWI